MPDTIATPTRELAYLGAIAGNNDAPENPASLKEQVLDQIAAKASVILVPEAGDSGKVLTAGPDGTASWQTASGGGGGLVITVADSSGSKVLNKTAGEIVTALEAGTNIVIKGDIRGEGGLYYFSIVAVGIRETENNYLFILEVDSRVLPSEKIYRFVAAASSAYPTYTPES